MITTSRYASQATRNAAKALASRQKERFVARGKRTVQQLVGLARKLGDARICIVEESGKKPGSVAEIIVDAAGRWKWKS